MIKFPNYLQIDIKDCGPTCLKIISKYYGRHIKIDYLRILSQTTREGSSLYNISEAAEKIGFRTLGVKISLHDINEIVLPCILHWNKEHYVVLYKVVGNRKWGLGRRNSSNLYPKTYYLSDPAFGLLEYNEQDFIKHWIGNNATEDTEEGIALLVEPTPNFHLPSSNFQQDKEEKSFGFSLLFNYILPYKSFVFQLIIGLLAGSLLQLIFPFLTQSVVDVGIQNQNIHFIGHKNS